jgi:prepilin-type N-terminal cleavage/methylation domain-containing protein
MGKALEGRRGFTLIELMIVVAILSVLAALAIPTFTTYTRRAKTVEATEHLSKMFDLAATYYTRERAKDESISAAHVSQCSVVNGTDNHTPGSIKQSSDSTTYGGGFVPETGLGFYANLVYYQYTLVNLAGSACEHSAGIPLYQLRAVGDLDDDGTTSLFQLAVGSDEHNELYRARTFYIDNETE